MRYRERRCRETLLIFDFTHKHTHFPMIHRWNPKSTILLSHVFLLTQLGHKFHKPISRMLLKQIWLVFRHLRLNSILFSLNIHIIHCYCCCWCWCWYCKRVCTTNEGRLQTPNTNAHFFSIHWIIPKLGHIVFEIYVHTIPCGSFNKNELYYRDIITVAALSSALQLPIIIHVP